MALVFKTAGYILCDEAKNKRPFRKGKRVEMESWSYVIRSDIMYECYREISNQTTFIYVCKSNSR